jgi:D-threo-aldose 1-dehydrogenase
VRSVTLSGTTLETSRLGLGCADLFRLPSRAQRRRLLDSAYEAGIRHFDVAPMYGLGAAEREVGAFARQHRGGVVVATKFGIVPTPVARLVGVVQGPARRLMERRPDLRRRLQASAPGPGAGSAGGLLYSAVGYDAAAARRSLHRSLRELRVEAVDLFLLHDPTPGSVRSDDVCSCLEEVQTAGQIVTWGIAGEAEPIVNVVESLPVSPPVIQMRDDVFARAFERLPSGVRSARITFGAVGAAVGRIVRHVASDARVRRSWHDAVGRDCGDPEVVAGLLLRLAARANPSGVVLFSSIRPERVRQAAAALGSDGAEDLQLFAALVHEELQTSRPRVESTR